MQAAVDRSALVHTFWDCGSPLGAIHPNVHRAVPAEAATRLRPTAIAVVRSAASQSPAIDYSAAIAAAREAAR